MGKIISFEGIDGSGKTYLSKKIAENLGGEGIYISKKSLEWSDNEFVKKVGKSVENILWHADNEPIELLTDESWFFLLMFWYTAFSHNVLEKYRDKYKYILLDGWFYKIEARYLLKKNFNDKLIEAAVGKLLKPDKIIYLDIDPEVCFDRKSNFSKCEIGRMDGESGNIRESFINYQQQVKNSYEKIIYSFKSEDIMKATNETSDMDILKFIKRN